MPRVRKALPTSRQALTIREKIEGATQSTKKSKGKVKQLIGVLLWPLKAVAGILRPILKPLAPIGRVIGKVVGWLVPRYLINSWRELRQVTWPSRRETWRLTAAVFLFAIIFGGIIAIVDKGLDEIFKKVILK